MLGVLKYPVAYSDAVNPDSYPSIETGKPAWLFKAKKQKPPKCYHDSEREIVDWILLPVQEDLAEFTSCAYPLDDDGKPDDSKHKKPIHKSLDTSIMELADDISYGLHDLEDAISLGMIDIEKWNAHSSGREDMFTACGRNSAEIAHRLFLQESHDRKGCIGDLVNLMITNTVIGSSKMLESAHPFLRHNAYLKKEFAALRAHLHELVKKHVIFDVNVQHLEFKGQRVVVELFEVLASDPERLLPDQVKKKFKDEQYNPRVICDFVAGMTDDYAVRLYDKIFSPGKGSIFERL
jgi:dGTPase